MASQSEVHINGIPAATAASASSLRSRSVTVRVRAASALPKAWPFGQGQSPTIKAEEPFVLTRFPEFPTLAYGHATRTFRVGMDSEPSI
ncbi:hypothetical protein [Moorena producens]|uniref:hypothetical protein n=1 Tax=Moorena producens TaxID=1155739 RepID=UPI003C750F18